MPRYFFDIHSGSKFSRDPTGMQCDGMKTIRHEVMHALPSIARDEIPKDGNRQTFAVLVRDVKDITVYTASLIFAGLWIGDDPIQEPKEDLLG